MNIRLSKKEDMESIRSIWEYCFDDTAEYVNYYFRYKFKPENTVILEDKRELIASIQLNQHKIVVNNKEFETSYFVGVSTMPQARGKGIMRDLMKESLYEVKKRKQSVAILMPIDFRLYTKYGFENCYDILVQKMDIFSLGKYRVKGEFLRADLDNISDLVDIYAECMKRYNGYAKRNKKYFEELLIEISEEGGYIFINYEDNIPQGYLVYSIESGKMVVREIYYKNTISYNSMLKFIYNHNTQCSEVELNSSIDDMLKLRMDNPKDAKFEIRPFMMARIIDFEKFIEEMSISVHKDYENKDDLLIEIEDDYIEENKGIFRATSKEGKLIVRKIEEINSSKELNADFKFNVNEMVAILLSYYSIDDLMFLKSEENLKVASFKKLFNISKKVNHINEYV
ncbi:GNAT family N-acetyltransferase [Peptostreptococcus faecalis]|uniref:GNAT family N-acetyltransferase n=1 Tax=Peptostreptococcus faecalis TaxID=2045015 RepID=UPI000C7E6058|nr:GNAT family N-acetyltransferase [Peptostreptococcus faecalis]